jgi:hypothetical protein
VGADLVEGDAEVGGGGADGTSLQDVELGDALALVGPVGCVDEDEGEEGGREAKDEAVDTEAKGAWGDAGEAGEVLGGLAVAVEGFEEGAVSVGEVGGAEEDSLGDVGAGTTAQVSQVVQGDVAWAMGGLEHVENLRKSAGRACQRAMFTVQ